MSIFQEKLAKHSLLRDSFLATVLAREVLQLAHDISIPNSPKVQKFLAKEFAELNTKMVSFNLPSELVVTINSTCKKIGVSRDVFFNRLFLMLSLPTPEYNRIFFAKSGDWAARLLDKYVESESEMLRELLHPLGVQFDPLKASHEMKKVESHFDKVSEIQNHEGKLVKVRRLSSGDVLPLDTMYGCVIHDALFGVSLVGLNCCFPESWTLPESRHLWQALPLLPKSS